MLPLVHSKRRTRKFIDGPVQNSRQEKKIHGLEQLKEITKNYNSDIPEGIEIENHKECIKTVREEEQAKYDSDSDHVIDGKTDNIICID